MRTGFKYLKSIFSTFQKFYGFISNRNVRNAGKTEPHERPVMIGKLETVERMEKDESMEAVERLETVERLEAIEKLEKIGRLEAVERPVKMEDQKRSKDR